MRLKEEAELFSFLQGLIPDLQWAPDAFADYDCLTRAKKCLLELKCRKTHYDKLLIERFKHEAILKAAERFKYTPVYVCSTPKGIWGFNLSKYELKWEKRKMPWHTEYSAKKDKVDKEVGYLSISDGKVLKSVEKDVHNIFDRL
jgi:hypothetical protein